MTQDLTCHKPTGDNAQPSGAPGDTTQPTPPEAPPKVIEDFHDSANALWTLQMNEAKCHDEARIQSLKGDMKGVLIFVRVHISIVICRLMHGHLGRSILRCSRSLYHR